ncbi:interleukin 21 receptor, tandem duplicate 1 [Aulostomus maculatus]
MAHTPVSLVLLWNLNLFIHAALFSAVVASSCNVTCSTDYKVLLNCSCPLDSAPTPPVLLTVNCSDGELDVSDSCQVNPPQSWCAMYPEKLDDVAVIGTMCTATVSHQRDGVITKASESSSWALSDVVKPLPPFDVHVMNIDGFYNITWDSNNQRHCLTYRVRIRDSKDLSKDPAHVLEVDQNYILLDHKKLPLHQNYMVDIQAKMCPHFFYLGPWSEWSSAAEMKTSSEIREFNRCWLYVPLSIFLVLSLLVLGYSQKFFWQKKLHLYTYVSKPEEFFKPLYQNHKGNFKEWVKPVFKEYDYFRNNTHAEMLSERQHGVLDLNNRSQIYSGGSEMKEGRCLLHVLQPDSIPSLLFGNGSSSEGTIHSTGHISIHTVTLYGDVQFEEDIVAQSSINTIRNFQDGEGLGSYNSEAAGYDLKEPQVSVMVAQLDNHIEDPGAQFNEPERVSLDSFASNDHSEDGYPQVDLDTIDSGFGECSSPGVSDPAGHRNNDLFQEHKNSNYVKQWMIDSCIPEDLSKAENMDIRDE